jgi:hypothetical protein
VLDEVRDAALRRCFVAGSAHQPDTDADGPNVRHRLGNETKTGIQDLASDHAFAGKLIAAGCAPLARTARK